ncbi:gp53-like domain-containing protein [Yersinia enterocolitica]
MALTLLSANNASTVLSAGISASATTLTVNTGTGGLFPSPVSGTSFFKLTLIDAATGTLTEIVHVTARTGDTMTIVRGQEGTVSRLWSANDIAANMMTAGTLDLFAQSGSLGGAAQLNVGTTAGTVAAGNDSRINGALQKTSNLSDLQSTSTARTNLGLGGAAVLNVGTTVGTVAAGDDPRITASLLKANNLSDLTNVPAALLNLGLGDAAKRGVGKSANQIPDISYFLASLGFRGHQDVPSLDGAGNFGLRWGTMSEMTAGPGQTVTFTRPFSSNCVFAIAFLIRPGSTNTGTSETMYLVSKSATQATFSKGGSESYSAIYLALGY